MTGGTPAPIGHRQLPELLQHSQAQYYRRVARQNGKGQNKDRDDGLRQDPVYFFMAGLLT